MQAKPIVWIQEDCVSPYNPALLAYPDAAAIFVWDRPLVERTLANPKHAHFVFEWLLTLPVTVQHGRVAEKVTAFARAQGADYVVMVESADPEVEAIRREIEAAGFEVEVLRVASGVETNGRINTERFASYWAAAKKYILKPQLALGV